MLVETASLKTRFCQRGVHRPSVILLAYRDVIMIDWSRLDELELTVT